MGSPLTKCSFAKVKSTSNNSEIGLGQVIWQCGDAISTLCRPWQVLASLPWSLAQLSTRTGAAWGQGQRQIFVARSNANPKNVLLFTSSHRPFCSFWMLTIGHQGLRCFNPFLSYSSKSFAGNQDSLGSLATELVMVTLARS